MTLTELRQKYPTFYYRGFAWDLTAEGLWLRFSFETPPDLVFSPTILIPRVTQEMVQKIEPYQLDQYVFNLGMVELLSYWKATCSPQIVVEAGSLHPDQIQWWHQLLLKGMGEYFYVNHIDFTAPDFVSLSVASAQPVPQARTLEVTTPSHLDTVLIPIGGGKDSVVTLEMLKQHYPTENLATLLVNPTQAATTIATHSHLQPQIEVKRTIDPKLFELNQQGYLNGHTPFSALVAFISILVADIWGYQGIAVSNERSSNEGNVCFNDVEINHQYSKTFEFEHHFQAYCQAWLPGSPYYFSFLRPLYELQIAKLFAHLTQPTQATYLRHDFRSCNRGQKTNSWCGECSKCLFAYTILSPFMSQAELQTIFGKNIFADESLWPIALDLLGKGQNKPLECVGTYEESLLAFYLASVTIHQTQTQLPPLLAKIEQDILSTEADLDQRANSLLQSWNQEHGLPDDLAELLKRATLNDIW